MLDVLIANKLIEKRQWEELATSITAGMDGERVQSTGAKSKMADAVGRCVDMEAEIDRAVAKLVTEKKKVTETLERLDSPIEYDILHRIFIQYQSLQDVADHYKKDYSWATTNQGRALKHLQYIMEQKEGKH